MVLVTGTAGLLGSHLLYELVQKGEKVKALIRSEESKNSVLEVFSYYQPNVSVLFNKIEWVLGDILDVYELDQAFQGVTNVYHCAAYISFNNKEKQKTFDVNIRGTANIVNQCLLKGIKKLVHVSSIAAIKSSGENNLTNEEKGWPSGIKSPYSYSKTQSEFEVWRGVAEGLNAVIVNPSVILGPGNWHRGSSLLFSRVYQGMNYFTKGSMGFIDVRDVVKIMVQLMDSDINSKRFILNGDNITYENLFKTIAKHLYVRPPQKYASEKLTEIAWRISKVKAMLTMSQPGLTNNTAKASHRKQNYSSDRIIEELGVNFIPMEETIKYTAQKFLKTTD